METYIKNTHGGIKIRGSQHEILGLAIFAMLNVCTSVIVDKLKQKDEPSNEILDESIVMLNLRSITIRRFKECGIETVGGFLRHTESDLLKYRDIGRKAVIDVKHALADRGLKLKYE